MNSTEKKTRNSSTPNLNSQFKYRENSRLKNLRNSLGS